ncbi:MAG: hypothetical protein IH964_10265 [Candidatus Dadabacteria bacterium]|nr:hypothetical protein [Candidatus Dadabacteria bacterium]
MNFLSIIRKRYYLILALFFFLLTFVVYYLTGEGGATPYNNFVRLADAFLKGRLHFVTDVSWLELVPLEGKHYVVPPPLPAILILPVVAIRGLSTNQTLISIFFGSINVSLAYVVAKTLTQNRGVQIWSTVMFGFGTIHWWVATAGGVWTFSQTISVTFLFIAILLTLNKNHPFLIGLSLGASYWTRLTTILSLPFFLIYTHDRWYKPFNIHNILNRINIRFLFFFGLGIAIFIFLNAIYNYARFETPFDISYYLIPGILEEPWYQKGIFDISYIPRHLKVIFWGLPQLIDEYPYIVPSWNGMAIWITTPAFIYAFRAGIRNKLSVGCWLSIILIALVNFSHGTWGFSQFGYRFAVDFYPFLFLLTVKGIGDNIKWHHKILIILGIIVNLWGVLWIHKFGWVGY